MDDQDSDSESIGTSIRSRKRDALLTYSIVILALIRSLRISPDIVKFSDKTPIPDTRIISPSSIIFFQEYDVDLPLPWFKEIRDKISNGTVVINFNLTRPQPYRAMAVLAIGFLFCQVTSTLLGYFTVKTLRKNMGRFSAKTYRLHFQLTMLVVAQVCLFHINFTKV
jgi:hypothetical protein